MINGVRLLQDGPALRWSWEEHRQEVGSAEVLSGQSAGRGRDVSVKETQNKPKTSRSGEPGCGLLVPGQLRSPSASSTFRRLRRVRGWRRRR